MSIETSDKASQALWPAYEKACEILKDYLEGKIAGSDKVKVATFVAGAMGKTMGAEAHKQTLELMQRRQAERAQIHSISDAKNRTGT